MDCSICVEKFNKTSRKRVVCNVCDYNACRMCYKTYITNEKTEAKCMSCKTQFSMKYLSENFEKKYIQKEYKEHIRNVLFEKELSLLQGTQVIVEKQIKK